ncbi:LCP family protein [Deinococcus pimensis]|uniref:LCP family protein n=1 Tax=Deinococcus pimensis TaxID=309888 RepID=UPI0004B5913B|nr:LCP family protein [Deinococcus pimensis]
MTKPPRPTTFYSERGRTVPAWRALQLAAITLSTLSLAGYWTLTSTAGETRRALAVTQGAPPSFTLLLAGRDIAYCYYHQPCKDQNSERARKETRTDSIMLLKFDGADVSVLNIPRDTQVGTFDSSLTWDVQKINAAYAFGGPERLAQRVSEITGERVDYYAVVRTTYVAGVIDALGGLDVNVPEPGVNFDDNAADLHLHLKPGPQKLVGKDAVAYLRMRKGVGDDYGRMDHQKAAIAQLVDRMRSPGGLSALPVILGGFSDGVETNADPALVQELVPFLKSFRMNFATLPTTEIVGTSNLAPDREALARLWGGASLAQVAERPATVRIFDASGADLGGRLAWALRARGLNVAGVQERPTSAETSQVFTLDEPTQAGSVARLLNLPRLQGLRFPVESGEVGVLLGQDAAARFAELSRLDVHAPGARTQ